MGKEIKVKIKRPRIYPVEPFSQYKNLRVWKILDQAIEDLVENQDLVETTVRKCIVGYLMKRLKENNIIK